MRRIFKAGNRRPALAGVILAVALSTSAAFAQTAPGLGMQPMSPMTAPRVPPPDLSPGPQSSRGDASAPLASSTQSCQSDISRISAQRMAAIEALNKLAKANKGKLDPIAACPRFRTLVRVETEFRNYLTKNKDWCGVPDQIVQTIQASAAKDSQVSSKACDLAVQFKKAQEQAAAGLAAQAPKLPAGPL